MKKLTCHCGGVEAEIKLQEKGFEKLLRCNCSICKRKFAKMNLLPKDSLKLTKGENNLGMYQFGTNVAKHFFCKTCGIYTHHFRKSDPNGIAINIGCIDEVDSFAIDSDVLDKK